MVIKLIKNIIKSIIECGGNAILIAFLFMFYFMLVKENGVKGTFKKWKEQYVHNASFRKVFLLMLYSFLVLTKTVLGRSMWHDPYGRIFIDWSIIDGNGRLNLAIVENIMLFVPFTFLVMWNMRGVGERNGWKLLSQMLVTVGIGFMFSTGIEIIQLATRLGTFQFSDIFYNSIGGIVGAAVYVILSVIGRGLGIFSKKDNKG